MKATLILTNIGQLYTCDSQKAVLKSAFLACHHHLVIDLGSHDYQCYVDKDTRILDCSGHDVIPAFSLSLQKSAQYAELYCYASYGVMSLTHPKVQLECFEFEQYQGQGTWPNQFYDPRIWAYLHQQSPMAFLDQFKMGQIEKNKEFNGLVLSTNLATFIQSIGRPLISHRIKQGIIVYPRVVRC